jgi:hypothetical protein
VIFGAVSMADRASESVVHTILCPMCLGNGEVAQQASNREAVVIGGVVCRSGFYQNQPFAVGAIVADVSTEVRESVASIRRECGLDTVRASRELTDYMTAGQHPA